MSLDLRKEALLNEYKGSLFEFLVARALAVELNFETTFLNELTENQISMYEQQEPYLRSHFPSLLVSLPKLAKSSAEKIIGSLELTSIDRITLVGMNAGSPTEADIILFSNSIKYPISLKISKKGSFTNTKSGGVKTFFSKYFGCDQSDFNFYYEQKFEEFTYSVLEDAGLPISNSFSLWEEKGLPVLPGQLSGSPKEKLFEFYEEINDCLFKKLESIQNSDPESFQRALITLLGFSESNLLQVTCFYKNVNEVYELDYISLKNAKNLISENEKMILKKSAKTIEIEFLKCRLQIRLKPMNKFTASAYKINCAIKFN